jgi:hypothetical protein
MDCGDRRENIYLDDVGRQDFLKALAGACRKGDWEPPREPTETCMPGCNRQKNRRFKERPEMLDNNCTNLSDPYFYEKAV